MDKDYSILYRAPFANMGIYDNIDTAEGSVNAIVKAVKNNYAIMLTVQRCKSGELVVFNDRNTFRMTNINGKVAKLDYNTLKNMPLFATGDCIPLLSKCLAAIPSATPIIVLVNFTKDFESEMIQLIGEINASGKNCCLLSHNHKVTTWLSVNYPKIVRGQLYSPPKHMKIMNKGRQRKLYYTRINNPDFVAYNIDKMPNKWLVKYAKASENKFIISYDVRGDEDINKALEMSNNFIFRS